MKPSHVLRGYILQALYAVYIYAVFKIILFKFGPIDFSFLWQQLQRSPGSIARQARLGNLVPFATISNTFDHLTSHSLLNFAGNIALFIPFGVFIPLLTPRRRISLAAVLLRAFLLSAVLECSQALFSIGTFDVDDLILNTLGGVLGCLFFRLVWGKRKGPSATKSDDGPVGVMTAGS